MEIKILGTGCPKCRNLEELIRKVTKENGINANIMKVEDIIEIMKFNIMTTPALVIDGKVMSKGRIPSVEELKKFLNI